ncbi:MAG: lysoplasmalogenase [Armatimonadetes bacterium]|nr:lysoplasmalogenase [Armatimonadota bacterium]
MSWASRAGVAVLLACALLQMAGVVAGPVLTAATETIPQWARLPGTLLLVLYAVLGWLSRQGGARRYAGLIAGGMLFGHLGDLAMGGVIPSPDGWLAGMLLFGLGHGFYIAAFVSLGRSIGSGEQAMALALVLGQAVGVVVWYALTANSGRGPVMEYGALLYALVICCMAALAVVLTIREPRLRPLACGALLFLMSDILLGLSAFRGVGGALWNDLIWVIYISGQALLVTSVARAAVVSPGPRTPGSSR